MSQPDAAKRANRSTASKTQRTRSDAARSFSTAIQLAMCSRSSRAGAVQIRRERRATAATAFAPRRATRPSFRVCALAAGDAFKHRKASKEGVVRLDVQQNGRRAPALRDQYGLPGCAHVGDHLGCPALDLGYRRQAWHGHVLLRYHIGRSTR